MIRVCSEEEFAALVLGTAAYATGGGGGKEEGYRLYREAFTSRGRCLELYSVDEVEGVIASPYFLGAMGGRGFSGEKMLEAMKLYSRVVGIKLEGVIPVELGAANTAVAYYIGEFMGVKCVDADRVGRAAPEIHQDTANIYGLKLTPSFIYAASGLAIVVHDYGSIDEYEAISRSIASTLASNILVVDAPLDASRLKRVALTSTVSRALNTGLRVLEARRRGEDPVVALAESMKGWIVFEGVVEEVSLRVSHGFLEGSITVRGVGDYYGHVLRSMVKNEHIAVWVDDKPLVLPPDLFTLVAEDGEPILNNEIRSGMRVLGVAAPAPDVWRSPRGLELFGPRRFGLEVNYTPVEVLVRKVDVPVR